MRIYKGLQLPLRSVLGRFGSSYPLFTGVRGKRILGTSPFGHSRKLDFHFTEVSQVRRGERWAACLSSSWRFRALFFYVLSGLTRVEPPLKKGRHERQHHVEHRRDDYRRNHQRPEPERQPQQLIAKEVEHGGYQRVDRQPGDRDYLVSGRRLGVPTRGPHEPSLEAPLEARDGVYMGRTFL